MSNKTTTRNYQYFKERVTYWQKELGQMGWAIHFVHEKLDDMFAETRMNNSSHVAVVVLSTDWGGDHVTEKQLNRTAFHEVLHLVFNNLTTEAKSRYSSEYDIDRAEHEVIRILENLVVTVGRYER